MTVTAKALINAKSAASSSTAEYTVPANTRTIIDKFTATNTDASSRTLSVYLVPTGQAAGASNQIVKDISISAGATRDFADELKNHILSAAEAIYVVASVSSVVTIRASGREVT